MLDFTALPTRNKFYAGANGAKIAVIYDGEQYMLKFPALAPKNKELSYANSCISEYIGCHIFNSVGTESIPSTPAFSHSISITSTCWARSGSGSIHLA